MIAAIVALVAAIVQPRFASCPPRAWMEGIASSGAYRCYVTGGTLEQNDPPHTLVRSGRVWCRPDELPVMLDHRRARCRRGRSKRGTTSARDPVLGAVEDYWSWRGRILRTLARWDGPATSSDIADAIDAIYPTERNTALVALRRLVTDGLVIGTRVDNASLKARGFFLGDVGCQYEYTLAPGAEGAPARKVRALGASRRCSRCRAVGHYARTCRDESARAA